MVARLKNSATYSFSIRFGVAYYLPESAMITKNH